MKGGLTVPFFVAANQIAYVAPQGMDVRMKMALHVVSGGPVFLWFGRKELSDAIRCSSDPNSLDFDFAASAAGTYESILTKDGLEVITLFSVAQAIGFMEFVPLGTCSHCGK